MWYAESREVLSMKLFQMSEISEAIQHAKEGGQALHLHSLSRGHPLFARYPEIAHLLDMNLDRLMKTAKALGVRVIKVERKGTDRQHIDLCGKPLERARKECAYANQIDPAV